MTLFHLVRHGEHALQGRLAAGRMTGIGLSPKGRAEAAAIAERLAGEKVDAIYASPLDRARETAEIIAGRLERPVVIREDVIEVDFGEWTGLTFDQVRSDKRWVPWQSCRSIAAIPGGESWRRVQERAVDALFDLRRAHPEGTVVVVSHGDVIRAALLFALGMPLDLYNRIEVATGSISAIRIDDGGIRVPAINERPRLV
ncbi:MAG TPA: histidine phosphatase family protein [Stellaceae bacterium]|nr:histidine phosphatase family protein [Stellaceae bacterium]